MRRDVMWTTAVLGGTVVSAVLVSLAGAARAPDVEQPLEPPPQKTMEAEGMGVFAQALHNDAEDAAEEGLVAKYAANRGELSKAFRVLGQHMLAPLAVKGIDYVRLMYMS